MVILHEVLDTRKLWDGWTHKLAEVMKQIPDKETVDIAHCRFGPIAWSAVESHSKRLVFINTEPEGQVLNEILKHNRNLADLSSQKVFYVTPEISDTVAGKGFKDLFAAIDNLDKDILISPRLDISPLYHGNMLAIMAVINLMFPARKVQMLQGSTGAASLKLSITDLINYYKSKLVLEDYLSADSFLFMYGGDNYIVLDFNLDEETKRIPGDRYYTRKDMYRLPAIPAWIGTELPSASPRVKNLAKVIIRDIKPAEYLQKTKKPETMKEFIEAYEN